MVDPDALVRDIVRGIAEGDVMTYGQVGQVAGLSPRHVGRIVARIADDIPWWRVVRADGTPAACHEGAAPALLREEGVPFSGAKVDRAALDAAAVGGVGRRPWSALGGTRPVATPLG